jgi:hypothetical protein
MDDMMTINNEIWLFSKGVISMDIILCEVWLFTFTFKH